MLTARLKLLFGATLIFIGIASAAYLTLALVPQEALAQNTAGLNDPGAMQWGFIAAALAAGLSSLGAGIAVASVGAAAVGAVAEKPDLFGRVLVLVGLAEGIAIYGLLISIMILNRLG